jgi:hypothetical protein
MGMEIIGTRKGGARRKDFSDYLFHVPFLHVPSLPQFSEKKFQEKSRT